LLVRGEIATLAVKKTGLGWSILLLTRIVPSTHALSS
jgi:hypothetical protein